MLSPPSKENLEIQTYSVSPEDEQKQVANISKVDDAVAFLLENEGKYQPLTEAEERWAVKKTDFILLPCLFWTATMGAVDKVSLGTAAIFGIKQSNHLTSHQYAWTSSILFFGSLVGMWPMSYLVQKYRPGRVIACASALWSCFTLLQCACHNFAGLAALRFLMGFVECLIVPLCSLIISVFYLKKESPHRTALVFAFMSSVINGGLSSLASVFGNAIPTWKYIYLLVGSISFVWSCAMIFFLPDSPINAKFLTTREKVFMVRRVASNSTGVASNTWKWDQVAEAFMDPRTYIVMMFNLGINLPNGALSTYSSIIIKNLGFSSVKSSLMGIPTGVIATIATVFFTWLGARWTNRRSASAMLSLIVPIIGGIVCYCSPHSNTAAQLVGLYFMYFYFASYVVMTSLVQANTAGNTKKAVTYGFNYLGYAAGAITGSQIDTTSSKKVFAAMLSGYCICMFLALVYWIVTAWMNKKKKAVLTAEAGETNEKEIVHVEGLEQDQILDITDFQQKHFFYIT